MAEERGIGFVGLCAAQLVSLRGGHPVLLEINPKRISFAKQLIQNVVNPNDEKLKEALKELAAGDFDVLYDTVGVAAYRKTV